MNLGNAETPQTQMKFDLFIIYFIFNSKEKTLRDTKGRLAWSTKISRNVSTEIILYITLHTKVPVVNKITI